MGIPQAPIQNQHKYDNVYFRYDKLSEKSYSQNNQIQNKSKEEKQSSECNSHRYNQRSKENIWKHGYILKEKEDFLSKKFFKLYHIPNSKL